MSKIKFEVNNRVGKEIFIVISLLSFALFCIMTYLFINTYGDTWNYVNVDAVITEVGYDYIRESDNCYSYTVLSYNYNNVTYTYKQRVAFRFNKKVGNKTSLYVNPDNPSEVRDRFNFRTTLFMMIFSFVFLLGMIPITIKRFKM